MQNDRSIDVGGHVPSGKVIAALDILNEYVIQPNPGANLTWAGNVHETVGKWRD